MLVKGHHYHEFGMLVKGHYFCEINVYMYVYIIWLVSTSIAQGYIGVAGKWSLGPLAL
jgi:hypothetical protein